MSRNDEKLSLDADTEALRSEWTNIQNTYEGTIATLKSENLTCKNEMTELRMEFDKIKLINNQLEAEHQMKFNFALKKVKREKDIVIKDLHENLETLRDELITKEQILVELREKTIHYEELNTSILSRFETLENANSDIKEQCRIELEKNGKLVDDFRNDWEKEKTQLVDEFEKVRNELEENWQKEKSALEIEFENKSTTLKDDFVKEKSELQEHFETEKLLLVECFEKDKNCLRESLESEKSSLILSCELDKQKYSEDLEKQSLSKTSSIE